MMKFVVAVICLIGVFDLATTQATVDFSEQAGSKEVREAIMDIKLNNISGGDFVKYEVSNIRITHFDADTVQLHNPSEMYYKLRLGGLHLSGEADIRAYKTVKFLWFFSHTVEATAKAYATFYDVHITQGAMMFQDDEILKAIPTDCTASIGSVNLRTDGQGLIGNLISTIFNFLKHIFDDTIKTMITRKTCPTINEELIKYLSQLDLESLKDQLER